MWTGEGFGVLDQHLVSLSSTLTLSAQQHLAYPVLHYFHSAEPSTAAAPSLRALSDALLLLQHGVAPDVRLSPAAVVPLDRSLDTYLGTLAGAFVHPLDEPLPAPSRAALRDAGIPLADDSAWSQAVAGHRERRRLIAGLLHEDGWELDAGAPAASATDI